MRRTATLQRTAGWWAAALACGALLLAGCVPGAPVAGGGPAQPIKLGLSAATSGGSAASGEAIMRGLMLGIDEINAGGGINGRPLELVVRDDEGNPTKGVANVQELVEKENVSAIFGGLHTPVAMAELDTIRDLQVPYVDPWAAGTAIVQNKQKPNWAFRVSANDFSVDEFLVAYTFDRLGKKNPAVLVEDTAWGESNIQGLTAWLEQRGARPAAVEKFKWGDTDMTAQLLRARDAGADAIIMAANAPEGAQVMRSLAKLGLKDSLPMVTHWGVTGGQFAQVGGFDTTNGVHTVQTFSFLGKLSPRAEKVLNAYLAKFGGKDASDITAPVGVANAYDAMQLVALALKKSGSGDRAKLRDALEALDTPYEGLIKTYTRPFTPDNHEALSSKDYLMTVWKDGKLIPESSS